MTLKKLSTVCLMLMACQNVQAIGKKWIFGALGTVAIAGACYADLFGYNDQIKEYLMGNKEKFCEDRENIIKSKDIFCIFKGDGKTIFENKMEHCKKNFCESSKDQEQHYECDSIYAIVESAIVSAENCGWERKSLSNVEQTLNQICMDIPIEQCCQEEQKWFDYLWYKGSDLFSKVKRYIPYMGNDNEDL